uniref:Membrane protein insertase YidC n=1 Tax=uncultured verrucomicrobium HF0500_27H16 TaxID=723600 RepID=E7C5J1_9BACT|nr:preprotein translocase subunit YidC [uncultured verrucomicrobium HF0500_27H16]
MDKNKLLGILFLAAAFWLMTQMPKPGNKYTAPGPEATSTTGGMSATGSATINQPKPSAPTTQSPKAQPAVERVPETTYQLGVEGQFVATFTSHGGAIKEVRFLSKEDRFRKFDPTIRAKLNLEEVRALLKLLNEAAAENDTNTTGKLEKQARKLKVPLQWIAAAKTQPKGAFDENAMLQSDNNYILNEGQKRPILELLFHGVDSDLVFQKTDETENSITFRAQHGDLIITRRYELAKGTFKIRHTTTLQNTGIQKIDLGSQVFYGLGTSLPTVSDTRKEFQNVGYFSGQRGWTGRRKPPIFKLQKMQKQGGSMMENAGGIHWVAVRNQFFAVSLAPDKPTTGVVKGKVFDLGTLDHRGESEYGVHGQFGLNTDMLTPGQSLTHEFNLYAGPKELKRLSNLSKAGMKHQDLVMQFGFFGLFSKLLLMLMQMLHGFVHNWGWAIIIMTILIKLLFWPLTAKSASSMKRMQTIQPLMKEIQAKYKDKPQKMQQEVAKLFRENKVNPAAGCLPILIQMPIFLGLFFMLRSAAELRFAEFFWVSDLSQPERMFHWGVQIPILGEYFNLLPILMGITMFYQMRMTPIPPGADDMQKMQAKMFRFLPFIFLFMLYGFSSGLVLYWTVQNILSIVQQTITNKRKDTEPVVLPGSSKKKNKG